MQHYHNNSFKKKINQRNHHSVLSQNSDVKKYFNSRNLNIAKLLLTTDRINNNKQDLNKQLLKLLERIDLDRPLVLGVLEPLFLAFEPLVDFGGILEIKENALGVVVCHFGLCGSRWMQSWMK